METNLSAILIITNLITLVSAIGGIAYFSLKGGNKASSDVIEIFKLRDTEQKELIAEYQKKFEDIKQEIGKLQGALQEKDKKLAEYVSIFQGRNPQQDEFMKIMVDAAESNNKMIKKSDEYMIKSTAILLEIRDFMSKMDKKMEAQKHFTQEVEEATATQTGKPLRKKTAPVETT